MKKMVNGKVMDMTPEEEKKYQEWVDSQPEPVPTADDRLTDLENAIYGGI